MGDVQPKRTMTLLLTTRECVEQEIDVLDALREHGTSFLELNDETIEVIEDLSAFREDLIRIDRQRDELIRINPMQVVTYREQHKQAEDEIARQIAKLKIPGMKVV